MEKIDALLKEVEAGNAEAEFELAELYYSGTGVERNFKYALYWLTSAAKRGFSPAQHLLGARYCTGDGVLKDPQRAVYWLKQCFENRSDSSYQEQAIQLWRDNDLWQYDSTRN